MTMRIVIKIGGTLIENDQCLQMIAQQLAELYGQGCQLILVHGGGHLISKALTQAKINSQFIDGLRRTTPDIIEVVDKVLCNQVNKQLQQRFESYQLPVVGLSGKDKGLIRVKQKSETLGLVGSVTAVQTEVFTSMMDKIPLVASIGIDQQGRVLNVNADDCAVAIAIAIKADQLLYLSEQPGVIANNHVVPTLTIEEANALIEKAVIAQGMIVKVKAIFHALKHGVKEVFLINAIRENAIKDAVMNHHLSGTAFRLG